MISKQKKLLYGAALAISSGLFANEVVNATQREEPPEPIERPAEAEMTGGESPVTATGTEPTSDPAPSLLDTPEAPIQKDPLAALEAALSKLGAADAAAVDDGDSETPRQRRKRPQPAEPVESEPAPQPIPEPAPRVSAAARAERRRAL